MGRDWPVSHALLFCFVVGSMYVVALYLIPQDIRALPRDSLLHIQYRIATSVVSTIVSVALFVWLVPVPPESSFCVALGFCTESLGYKLMTTALLMSLFYLGPIATFVHYVIISLTCVVRTTGICTIRESRNRESSFSIILDIMLSDALAVLRGSAIEKWIAMRGLIFAPVTEELVYRSVLAPALYLALVYPFQSTDTVLQLPQQQLVYTPWVVVWVNPLWFGMAHLHHLIEKINSGWKLLPAVLSTFVQLIYTSIFGCIATLLLLRTGTIYTSILSHVICNSVGLPDTGFMCPPGAEAGAHYSCMYQYRYMHLVLHVSGLMLFTALVLPLTEEYAERSMYWS